MMAVNPENALPVLLDVSLSKTIDPIRSADKAVKMMTKSSGEKVIGLFHYTRKEEGDAIK